MPQTNSGQRHPLPANTASTHANATNETVANHWMETMAGLVSGSEPL